MINYLLTYLGAIWDLLHSPLVIFLAIMLPLLLWWVFMVEKRDGFRR